MPVLFPFRGFAASVAAVAVSAGAASAQPVPGLVTSPDFKGFHLLQLMGRVGNNPGSYPTATLPAVPRFTARRSVVVASPLPPLQVSITIPAARTPDREVVTPDAVTIRGPDGEVRRFAVEGGRDALTSRVFVVRPGERATIVLAGR